MHKHKQTPKTTDRSILSSLQSAAELTSFPGTKDSDVHESRAAAPMRAAHPTVGHEGSIFLTEFMVA